MPSRKVSFYFVLYLVVLVELLAVIIERDNSEIELKKRLSEYETIQDSIIAAYNEPISLSVQNNTDWLIIDQRDSLHLIISVSNLQTPEEKASVKYYFVPDDRNEEVKPTYSVFTDKKTGNGHFFFKTGRSGTSYFNVYCLVQRKFPKYLPEIILEGIAQKVGDQFNVRSDTVDFKINTKIQTREFDQPGRG